MDYYTAMEEAMIEAAEDSFLPTELTRDQMLIAIETIGNLLKGSLGDGNRILLSARRHELRLRLQRAEGIAMRLRGAGDGKNAQEEEATRTP